LCPSRITVDFTKDGNLADLETAVAQSDKYYGMQDSTPRKRNSTLFAGGLGGK
jgi:hypothetical protein